MKLIVGLGNPGVEYALTRHNVGWNVLDRLAEILHAGESVHKFSGEYWPASVGQEKVFLLKPYTYMNESGTAVGELARFFKISPEDVLVLVDDIHLPVGRLRLRGKGSAGGHNGLKSIIAHLGSQDFPRLRVGVGEVPRGREQVGWVLGKFSPEDRILIDHSVYAAASFAARWCTTSVEALQSRVNSYDANNESGEA